MAALEAAAAPDAASASDGAETLAALAALDVAEPDAAVFEASDARRAEEVVALEAAAAATWVRGASAEELVASSVLRCGAKGRVEILEASPRLAESLRAITAADDGESLAAAVAQIAPLVDAAAFDAGRSGCVLLRNTSAALLPQLCAALGEHLMSGALRKAPAAVADGALPLGNDVDHQGQDLAAIALACDVPPMRGGAIQLTRSDAVCRALSHNGRAALTRAVPYKAGDAAGAAPLISVDACGGASLKFSRALRDNVEWSDDVDETVLEALAEAALHADALCFALPLRRGDVLVLDAARWLWGRAEVPPNDHGAVWFNGNWTPPRAVPPNALQAAPTGAVLVHATFQRRPPV